MYLCINTVLFKGRDDKSLGTTLIYSLYFILINNTYTKKKKTEFPMLTVHKYFVVNENS